MSRVPIVLTSYPEPLLAECNERLGQTAAIREERADRDVPCQRKCCVGRDACLVSLTLECAVALHESQSPIRQDVRSAEGANALFSHVADKVADVEGRIAGRVEIEVQQVQVRARWPRSTDG